LSYLSFTMSLASIAYREVEAIVETWTKKYQYHISLIETKPNEVKYFFIDVDLWCSSVFRNLRNPLQLGLFACTSVVPTTTNSR
jgi:hypothetical protein